MKTYEEILERAVERHGSVKSVTKKMPKPKSARQMRNISDAEYLSLMSRRIFRAGLRHDMVDAKWPAFKEVFHDFDINRVMLMSDEDLERLMNDRRIIRHWGKIKSVRANAHGIYDVLEESSSFADYLVAWPGDRIVELWEDLKKRFSQLGGNSAPYFLRMAGKDTFLLTRHVISALNQWGAYQGDPKTKKAKQAVQEVFNQWSEDSGKPLSHISMTLALSVE